MPKRDISRADVREKSALKSYWSIVVFLASKSNRMCVILPVTVRMAVPTVSLCKKQRSVRVRHLLFDRTNGERKEIGSWHKL